MRMVHNRLTVEFILNYLLKECLIAVGVKYFNSFYSESDNASKI